MPRKYLIFAIVLFLTSCNSIKLSYQFADWILLYKIRNYIELNDSQENQVEIQINQLIQWHSTEELPKYINFLEDIKIDIQTDKLIENWDILQLRYQNRQNVLLKRLIHSLSPILVDLSAEQLTDLKENIEEDNEELIESRDLTIEERKEKRVQRYIKNYEYWIGSLTEEQTRNIKEFGWTLPLTTEIRLEQRLKGQSLFFDYMENREITNPKIRMFLIRLWVTRDYDWAQRSVKHWKEIKHQNKIFLDKFAQSISGEQRKYLLEQIDSTILDIKDIIGDQISLSSN